MTISPADLAWLALLGTVSGSLGAITGIGGGVIIVPALFLFFGADFAVAAAASLAAVIANSTAAGVAYVAKGLTNMRLSVRLEAAAVVGGIAGGSLGVFLSERALSAIFGITMLATAIMVLRGHSEYGMARSALPESPEMGTTGSGGSLDARYLEPDVGLKLLYPVRRIPTGMGLSLGAGTASGLLGVGGGFVMVPSMNLVMGIPIKVAAATSSFTIGVTAVSGFLVYLGRGVVHPGLVAPLVLGTVLGASVGARFQSEIPSRYLTAVLAAVLMIVAVQMGLRGIGVGSG